MIKLFKSKLVDKKIFGSLERAVVIKLKFELVEGGNLEFKPGQFVNVMLPGKVARAYSIGLVDNSNLDHQTFELCVDYIPNGIGSEFFNNLQIGEEMIFKAPFGRFTLQEIDVDKDVLFIGLATGIVPLVAMVEGIIQMEFAGVNSPLEGWIPSNLNHRDGRRGGYLTREDPPRPITSLVGHPSRGELATSTRGELKRITILHGVPYEELDYYDEFFKSKIEIAKQAGIELNFERWVSRPTENYSGNRGRVSVHIDQLQISKNTAVYICGGNEAIKSIREHLVMKGVDENDFRTERFY